MRLGRLFVIALVGVVVVVVDAALLFAVESIPPPVDASAEGVDEPVRHLVFAPSRRRANFEEMGFDEVTTSAAAAWAERWSGEKARLSALLLEHAGGDGARVCAGRDLPQPYSLLAVLVAERNGVRDVPAPDRLSALAPQPWSAAVPFDALYREVELRPRRAGDATALALAAVLAGREAELLDGRLSGRGPLDLVSDDPGLTDRLVRYLGLMHLLVEVGNAPDGICSGR
jgi:hypothetical protein